MFSLHNSSVLLTQNNKKVIGWKEEWSGELQFRHPLCTNKRLAGTYFALCQWLRQSITWGKVLKNRASKFLKDYLLQIFLGPFLNTLPHIIFYWVFSVDVSEYLSTRKQFQLLVL